MKEISMRWGESLLKKLLLGFVILIGIFVGSLLIGVLELPVFKAVVDDFDNYDGAGEKVEFGLVINDEEIELQEENYAIIEEGQVLVPARVILAELGMDTAINQKKGSLVGSLGDFELEFFFFDTDEEKQGEDGDNKDKDLDEGNKEESFEKEIKGDKLVGKKMEEDIYAPIKPLVQAVGVSAELISAEENSKDKLIYISTPSSFDPEPSKDPEDKTPGLNVSYPPEDEYSIYNSPLFVFGTTDSYSKVDVLVNGEPVEKLDLRTGNFLTMVDVPLTDSWDDDYFPIEIKAVDSEGNEKVVERSVKYSRTWYQMSRTPPEIHNYHLKPDRDQVLGPGDTLEVFVQGSPGAEAVFWLGEDEENSVQMEEMEENPTPLAGGIYRGVYEIDQADDVTNYSNQDYLPINVRLSSGDDYATKRLPGKVNIISETPYKTVEVKEQSELGFDGWLRGFIEGSFQLHSGTGCGTVNSISAVDYLVEGTPYEVVGVSGSYYRVRFKGDKTYLIHRNAVVASNRGELNGTLNEVEIYGKESMNIEDKLSVRLGMDERVPFLVQDEFDQDSGEIQLWLEGAVKAEEGRDKPEKSLDSLDSLESLEEFDTVKSVSIETGDEKAGSSETNGLLVSVELERRITGFETRWEEEDLFLHVYKHTPIQQEDKEEEHFLEGKTVIIDPGHGGDDKGALGPGELHEKDIALDMSFLLKEKLENIGVNAVLVRRDDENVDLYERTSLIKEEDADLFISVHANAHPQGRDAVENHGLMTLYNHSHNEELAEIMLDRMKEETGLPAIKTWKRNIAVLRYPYVPSVLVEAGYMKNPEDNWYIFHPTGQKKFARAMKEGIIEYFQLD